MKPASPPWPPEPDKQRIRRLQAEVRKGRYKTSSRQIALSLIRSHLIAELSSTHAGK